MALKQIKWKQADYTRLRKAVNRFNRIVDKVADKEIDTIPERLNYSQVKSEIFTRKGLNERIRALNRLTEENAVGVHETKTGIEVSKYNWGEVKLAEKRWKTRLKKQKAEYEKIQEGMEASRVSMGSRNAQTVQLNLERNISKELNEVDTVAKFNEKFQALMNRASEDKIYEKTLQYKENYLTLMRENYSNYDNYEKFLQKVENMSPEEFYKFMQKDELTEDLYYQSNQTYSQPEFDNFLESLGIIGEDEITS